MIALAPLQAPRGICVCSLLKPSGRSDSTTVDHAAVGCCKCAKVDSQRLESSKQPPASPCQHGRVCPSKIDGGDLLCKGKTVIDVLFRAVNINSETVATAASSPSRSIRGEPAVFWVHFATLCVLLI